MHLLKSNQIYISNNLGAGYFKAYMMNGQDTHMQQQWVNVGIVMEVYLEWTLELKYFDKCPLSSEILCTKWLLAKT